MTATSYNLSIGAGVACVGIGAGAQWGWPVGLMAVGGLVVALTLNLARILSGGR